MPDLCFLEKMLCLNLVISFALLIPTDVILAVQQRNNEQKLIEIGW